MNPLFSSTHLPSARVAGLCYHTGLALDLCHSFFCLVQEVVDGLPRTDGTVGLSYLLLPPEVSFYFTDFVYWEIGPRALCMSAKLTTLTYTPQSSVKTQLSISYKPCENIVLPLKDFVVS